MASYMGDAPTPAHKSPNPSEYRDSPYAAVLHEAQGTLMEKVQNDVGHVVNSLEAICARAASREAPLRAKKTP